MVKELVKKVSLKLERGGGGSHCPRAQIRISPPHKKTASLHAPSDIPELTSDSALLAAHAFVLSYRYADLSKASPEMKALLERLYSVNMSIINLAEHYPSTNLYPLIFSQLEIENTLRRLHHGV